MTCPRCEKGTIIKIQFRKDGRLAHLCDVCGAIWFAGEEVSSNTSHFLHSFSSDDDREYIIEEVDEKDYEHRPAKYVDYK